MKRRQFVRQVAIGVVGAGTLVGCSRGNQFFKPSVQQSNLPRVEWRMATSWPEPVDTYYDSAKLICNRVSQLTNGGFVITPFPGGGIAPPLKILDPIQAGSIECGHTEGIYYLDSSPALSFATNVPFGFSPNQLMAWLHNDGGIELVRKAYADFNVMYFPAGTTGAQMGGWFKKKIQSLADLKGLKMRMPGMGGRVVKQLGVDAKSLPFNEIAPAFERGNIDAAEFVGPYEDEKLGLNKYAQFYYYPGWHEPGTNHDLIINRDNWNKLPKEYQSALNVASFEAQVMSLSWCDAKNRQALQRLLKSGTQIMAYNTEVLNGLRKVTFEVYDDYAGKDATFREIYTHWKSFRQEIYAWNRLDDMSFADFAFTGN